MSSYRIYPKLQDQNEPPVAMPRNSLRRTSLPCRKLNSEKKFEESMQTFSQLSIRSDIELPTYEHTPPPTYEHSMTLFRNTTSLNQSSSRRNTYPKSTET